MNKTASSTHKIRFADCDMFGHLNNSRYLDYMIDAREDHLKQYYDFDMTSYYQNGLGWVIGNHEIAYLRPAVYNEMVCLQSSLLMVTEELLFVEILMLNEKQNHLKAILRSKLIPINIKTGKKIQHNEEFTVWAKSVENTAINAEISLQERAKELVLSFGR